MTVIKYIRLPFRFDILQMQQEVKALSANYWQLHYQTMHYDGNWSAIPLRSVGGMADNIIISPNDNDEYKDTIFLKQNNYLSEVLSTFKAPLQAVRLLKLDAGAVIKEHRDAELSYEHGSIRIHIPIATNDEVEFYLNKERMKLGEGECWYLNFNLPHYIINNSKEERIHLVIDALVNDWVKELFEHQAVVKKEIENPGYDNDTKQSIIAQLRLLNTETGNRLADEMEASLLFI